MPTYQAEIDEPKPETPCECGSCDWTGTYSELDEIEDCSLTPGDPSPAGRCPLEDCGSLVYIANGREDVLKARVAALEAGLRDMVGYADEAIADREGSDDPEDHACLDLHKASVAKARALLDGAPAAVAASERPSWDHPRIADWVQEVAAGDTMRGFADWLAAQDEEVEG